jgi:hypothetical protein
MIEYRLTKSGVLRTTDKASIPNAEGNSDWQQYLIWVSEGNTPIPLPLSEYYNLVNDAWVYDIDRNKTDVLNQINTEVNTYINTYYDAGTQQSFTALYVKVNTDEVKNYLNPVWDWINTIMTYYYGKKTDITNATTSSALTSITWDFTTFDATKPSVSLQSLMSSIS